MTGTQPPDRPPSPDRWGTWFPRLIQSLGAAGGFNEIFINKAERPWVLLFIGGLILGMEGVRAFVLRRFTNDD